MSVFGLARLIFVSKYQIAADTFDILKRDVDKPGIIRSVVGCRASEPAGANRTMMMAPTSRIQIFNTESDNSEMARMMSPSLRG